MEAVLLELAKQLNSSVFTLLVILVVVGWLLYKSGGWAQIFKDFRDNKDNVNNKIDDIKGTILKVQATTDLLYQSHLSTVQAHSPLSLTDKGQKINKDLKLKKKLGSHWSLIKKKIKGFNPKNPYDIQTVSMNIARDCFENFLSLGDQEEIKTYAYTNGVNLLEIYPILGVLIRDRFFKEEGIVSSALKD